MMKELEKEMELREIKQLFEYCYIHLKTEGLNSKTALMIFKNKKALETPYEQISQNIYLKENDPEFQKFIEKNNRIVLKYVDRNEQGEPIFDENKEPAITEMIVEYQKEMDQLLKDNEELLKTAEEKTNANGKFLSQKVPVTIFTLDIDEISDKVPPYIVGLVCS